MRLTAHCKSEVIYSFGQTSSTDEIRKILRSLADRVVLSDPAFDLDEWKKWLMSEMPESKKVLLESLHESTSFSYRGEPESLDVRLDAESGSGPSLATLMDNDEFSLLADARSRVTVREGSDRSAMFDASLGIIAPLSTRVQLLDRYAATHITDQGGWLLDRLLDYPHLDIHIHTGLQDARSNFPRENDHSKFGIEAKLNRLQAEVEKLLDAHPQREGILVVDVYPQPRTRHHRRIGFRFDRGPLVNVALDIGANTFSRDHFGEATTFATYPPEDFTNCLAGWDARQADVAKFKWAGCQETETSFGVKGGNFGKHKYLM
jgi:hypothetical protein